MGRPSLPWPPAFDQSQATRKCTKCKSLYPPSAEFFGVEYGELKSWCRGCLRNARHTHYHRGGGRLHQLKSGKTPEGRFNQIRIQAAKRGKAFTLDFQDDFMPLWDAPCTYCGQAYRGGGLDRVDNSRGYEPDNVASCCPKCNFAKGKMPTEEFKAHISAIAKHLGL